jgi:hypothetical protein
MTVDEAFAALTILGRGLPFELIDFGLALDSLGYGPDVDGWQYFLTRPEKWTDEYVAWVGNGRPTGGGLHGSAFAEALAAMNDD